MFNLSIKLVRQFQIELQDNMLSALSLVIFNFNHYQVPSQLLNLSNLYDAINKIITNYCFFFLSFFCGVGINM